VSGQYFRNLSKFEIEVLFRNNSVLMDGEAAYTLFDLGLGPLASINTAVWHDMGSGYQTYEEVCGSITLCGVLGARMTAQAGVGDYMDITYDGGTEFQTLVKDYAGKTVGPGVTVIGGHHLVYPYGRFNGRVQGHLNPYRRELLLRILKDLKGASDLVYIEESPYIAAAAFTYHAGHALVVTNFSNDPVPVLHIHIPQYTVKEVNILRRSGQKKISASYSKNDGIVSIPFGLRSMETLIILLTM
jgi:hypothetical protein